MDKRIQEIIDFTADKFKLKDYHLKSHSISRDTLNMGETVFILNMEWEPNDAETAGEDYNPAGTISIDVNIHSKLVRRIIFVHEENKSEADLPKSGNTERTIEWIEQETGLEFGRQFKLIHEEEKELFFQAAVDNIAVFPSGSIQIEFNAEGKLSLFSIDGHFPDEEQLNWEPFALTAESIEPIARAQSKLLEIPLEDKEKWTSVYGITTAFVTNDAERTISFEQVESPKSYVKEDAILEWTSPINEPFVAKAIDLSLEVTADEAFLKTESSDDEVLTVNEQTQAKNAVDNFLRQAYQQDSGKWLLAGLWRDQGYIFAELKPATPTARVIDRKIRLIIDANNYQALNYVDNKEIVDMFEHFGQAEEPLVSEQSAFDKLRKHIEITPVYVFDKNLNRYVLCGKVDCGYGVDSVTGEVVLLDEL